MNNQTQFDIFEFLGIEVTDDLEKVQNALNDLSVDKMAKLQMNPEFSKLRIFLLAESEPQNMESIMQNEELCQPGLFPEQIFLQERVRMQRLVNTLNQTPWRKTSLNFLLFWLFGNNNALTGLLCFAFFGIPAIFVLLAKRCGIDSIETLDVLWVLGDIVFAIGGIIIAHPLRNPAI